MFEIFQRVLGNGAVDDGSGIGHDDVDAPKLVDGVLEQPDDLCLVADVCLDGDCRSAAVPDVCDHGIGGLLIMAVVDNNVEAVGCQPPADFATDCAGATGDDCCPG